ncbi:unnamed protein product, partial [marine sediment metagenome]
GTASADGRWDPASFNHRIVGWGEPIVEYHLNVETKERITKGILAKNWTRIDRPDQGSNVGGVKAYEFTLEDNVRFSDGSKWNASVAKWNFDRAIEISGKVQQNWKSSNWFSPIPMKSRFNSTPGYWDLTQYINVAEVSRINATAPGTIADGSFINYTAHATDYYIWFDTNIENKGVNIDMIKTIEKTLFFVIFFILFHNFYYFFLNFL